MFAVNKDSGIKTLDQLNGAKPVKSNFAVFTSNLVEFLKLLQKIASKLRYNYRIISNITKLNPVKNSPKAREFIIYVKRAKIPINSTSIFNIISLVDSIPKLWKSTHKIAKKDGVQKIPVALKIINTLSSIIGTIEDVRSGIAVFTTALKVSTVVSSVFSWIGIAGSAAETILSARKLWQTQTQLNEFTKVVNYNKEGVYDFQDYRNLCQFFEESAPKHLGKQFGKDEKFYQHMREKLATLNPSDPIRLKEIINNLKSRLEVQRNDKIVSLVSNSISLVVSVAITVASITNPVFLLVWTGFNLAFSGIRHVVMQIKDYEFNNSMGLIHRGNIVVSRPTFFPIGAKVKDFVKWYFGYYPSPKTNDAASI